MEKFCYLAGTIGARVGAFDSVLTRIRSGCCKLKKIVLLFASRNTFPVKKEDVIRLERNDSRMARWICTVRPQQRISTEELRARLKLNSLRECLQNRRLQLFILKEWKRVLGLINLKPRLAVVSPEDGQWKHGIR